MGQTESSGTPADNGIWGQDETDGFGISHYKSLHQLLIPYLAPKLRSNDGEQHGSSLVEHSEDADIEELSKGIQYFIQLNPLPIFFSFSLCISLI